MLPINAMCCNERILHKSVDISCVANFSADVAVNIIKICSPQVFSFLSTRLPVTTPAWKFSVHCHKIP